MANTRLTIDQIDSRAKRLGLPMARLLRRAGTSASAVHRWRRGGGAQVAKIEALTVALIETEAAQLEYLWGLPELERVRERLGEPALGEADRPRRPAAAA
jgi:hypothetical protein